MVTGAPIRLTNATDPPYGLILSARVAARGSISEPASERPAGDGAGLLPGDEETDRYRWAMGMTIEPEPCGGGVLIDPCAATYREDSLDEPDPIGPVQPFVATASVRCSTFGSRYDTRRARALRKLRGSRSLQLEREFWTGIRATALGYPDNQYLTKEVGGIFVGSYVNFGQPTALATAFAELEQAIADASSWAVGMIHCQPRTFAHWYRLRLFDMTGGIGISPLGTIVVAGRGYPGTGPGDTDLLSGLGGDASYAYATSQVYVRLGEETVLGDAPDNTDQAANTLVVTAEQPMTANWDGCVHAAVLVNHTAELGTTGS